jgi:uncharacterized Tic20 family protein
MNLRPEERTWAVWCHLTAFVGLLGVPFGHIIGPMVTWQMKKEESAFVDSNGKEALNFQISLTLYAIAAATALLVFIFTSVGVAASRAGEPVPPGTWLPLLLGGYIGPVLALLLFPAIGVIGTVVGAAKAASGKFYRYPLTIRFLR